MSSLVNRDIAELMRLTDPARVTSVLRLLAANQAGELVRARLSKQTSIPESTLTSYISLLRSLYLIDELPPWTANLARREIGRPKVFLPDGALAMHLSGVTQGQLATNSEYFGRLLEAFVAAELRRQQSWSNADFRLYSYRNSNGREVDCLVELSDGRIIAIEVKASSTLRSSYFGHLAFLRDKLGPGSSPGSSCRRRRTLFRSVTACGACRSQHCGSSAPPPTTLKHHERRVCSCTVHPGRRGLRVVERRHVRPGRPISDGGGDDDRFSERQSPGW
ncbi:DUF4143 domain-containing protein [Corynebacterium glyciniphilum]|uniref:DUF4143 domain-containing protein n=1 Tax=Corynebacterium glyciniphilum TaxID=1404244 RepID=UPI003DA0F29F